MIDRPVSRRACILSLAALGLSEPLLAATPTPSLPGNSVYQLKPTLTDQNGQAFDLSSLRGQPVLASMFYTSCQMVCPMIFETIQKTIAALRPAEQERLRILMVTFDPARDTTEVLKRTAQARGCSERWSLVRTDETSSRKIAAVLGVQYRRLTDGEFNHSSGVELLDSEGRLIARTSTLGSVDPSFLKSLRQSLVVAA